MQAKLREPPATPALPRYPAPPTAHAHLASLHTPPHCHHCSAPSVATSPPPRWTPLRVFPPLHPSIGTRLCHSRLCLLLLLLPLLLLLSSCPPEAAATPAATATAAIAARPAPPSSSAPPPGWQSPPLGGAGRGKAVCSHRSWTKPAAQGRGEHRGDRGFGSVIQPRGSRDPNRKCVGLHLHNRGRTTHQMTAPVTTPAAGVTTPARQPPNFPPRPKKSAPQPSNPSLPAPPLQRSPHELLHPPPV